VLVFGLLAKLSWTFCLAIPVAELGTGCELLQVSIFLLTFVLLGGRLSVMNKAAQVLGRLGGLKRAANMTSIQRQAAAALAANARWTAKRQALPVPSAASSVK
jgi:hypothetical protein